MVTGGQAVIRLAANTVRRFLTWGLVAAVAALGLAAGIDALRGGEEPEPAAVTDLEPPTTSMARTPEGTLAEAGAALEAAGVPAGRLVYSDESCATLVLTLPGLAERPARGPEPCRFGWTRGRWIQTSGPEAGDFRGRCRDGRLSLETGPFEDPVLYARGRGCGAAWKPDGTITFIGDDGVRRFVRCPDDRVRAPLLCSRPLLTNAELVRQLDERWSTVRPRIEEHSWLDDELLAVVFRQRTPDGHFSNIVLFDRGRLVNLPVGPYRELRGLRTSPTGRFAAAAATEQTGLVVVNRDGEPVWPTLFHGSAVAWSPDEQWIAEAAPAGIWVYRAHGRDPDAVRIPVRARDVLWEP